MPAGCRPYRKRRYRNPELPRKHCQVRDCPDNPAFWFVTDVIINSGTPDLVGCRNHVFYQTGCCGNQLKGGTGCGLLLRRIIEQRRRFIMLQRCKIFRIHTIGKFVAVISGITYHGKNFPCFSSVTTQEPVHGSSASCAGVISML